MEPILAGAIAKTLGFIVVFLIVIGILIGAALSKRR